MRDSYTAPVLVEHPPLTDVTGQTTSIGSDRDKKANFAPVSGREVLERLASVPIVSWNRKSEPASIRHVGPIDQDFHGAFQLGRDDRALHPVDANGVALAAIQGLRQAAEESNAQLTAQQERIAALEGRLAALENDRCD